MKAPSELRELQRQISMAITMIEADLLTYMSPRELKEHAARYGKEAIVIGDFVITRRAKTGQDKKEEE